MNTWKLRLLLMGGINALIALVVLTSRGLSTAPSGLFVVGDVVMALGLLLWR
jgi:hypothetical protein